MLLNIFDHLTGKIKTALKLASYTINVDYLNPCDSQFEVSINTFEEDLSVVNKGDLAMIPKWDLAGTPFEKNGWCGSIRSIVETDGKITIVCREITYLLGFDMIYTADSELGYNEYVRNKIYQKYKENEDTPENLVWVSVTYDTSGTWGKKLPAYDKYSIKSFKDVLNDLYLSDNVVVYPIITYSATYQRLTVTFRIEKAKELQNVLLEGSHVSGVSLTESIDESPNKLVLNPANGNLVGKSDVVYYLHTNNEVDTNKNTNRITPVITIFETYADEDYYGGGEEKLLEMAKAKLLPTTQDKELTFTLTDSPMLPLEDLSPRCKITFYRKGKKYEGSLSKISMNNNKQVTITLGYKRLKITDKMRNVFEATLNISKGISSVRRNRDEIKDEDLS